MIISIFFNVGKLKKLTNFSGDSIRLRFISQTVIFSKKLIFGSFILYLKRLSLPSSVLLTEKKFQNAEEKGDQVKE